MNTNAFGLRVSAWRRWAAAAVLVLAGPAAHAGLFDDEEARKAILDLRTRLTQLEDANRSGKAEQARLAEQVASLQRSVLDLNTQLDQMRGELATLRGNGEQVARGVSELQRTQKDANQNFDDRLRKLEPQKVSLDGREFDATPQERRAYDDAVATLRSGNFDAASDALAQFQSRYPNSGYLASARFWHGNALYGKRDYKGAITAFRSMVADAPQHPKAPEALLALANSQAEAKDARGARKTLDELIKTYPQSEAAAAGKERLASLR